jgi:hypothetical protein
LIKAIYKELYNTKILILKTLILIPSINKIKITIFKPNLLNINPKPAIVAQLVSIINLILIIKFKKLPDLLIFNKN